MKVTPGILMKTKGDGKQVAEESVPRAGNGGFQIHDSKCGAKTPYDGISPEVPENNEAHNPEQPIRAPKFRQQRTRRIEAVSEQSRPAILSPDSCLLHSRNERDSGDIDENKERGFRCQVSGVSGDAASSIPLDYDEVFLLVTPALKK
jgi:hypothetical protein